MELTRIGRKTFLTDILSDRHDCVFPLFEDESIHFAKNLRVRKGGTVLDLGTGSGVLAVFAAKKAKAVHATDISERALLFARLNARLNGVHDKIEFIKKDTFGGINGKYDAILINPPFSPRPPGIKIPKFADGGTDGLKQIRRICKGLSDHVKPGGRVQMIIFSLGSEEEPAIFELIRRSLGKRNARIEYTHLYPPMDQRRFEYLKRTFPEEKHRKWVDSLSGKYPYAYYMMLTAHFDKGRGVTFAEKKAGIKFREREFSGSWEARLRRRAAVLGAAVKAARSK